MLPSFASETIVVRRAPLVDVRGTKVRDWANATEHEIAGVSVQPASTSREFGGRTTNVADGWTLYGPPGADIEAGDRIVYGGTTYEIDGAPYEWKSPTGRVSHVQAKLAEWRG